MPGEDGAEAQDEMTPELVADVHAALGEGPAWDDRTGVLWWVDIDGRSLHGYEPLSGHDVSHRFDRRVTAVVPRHSGGLLLTMERSFVAYDPATRAFDTIASVEADLPGNRMNDGKCDRQGRFWAGTMALEWEGAPDVGGLYRLELDGAVSSVLGGVTVSNGLAWSLDDRAFFYIDSPAQRVDRFRFDPASGAITERQVLATIPTESGLPDGCAMDAEGFLWVALWGGSAVWRIATDDGRVDRVIRLPASQVTSCAFGGVDLEDLYITTAAVDLSATELAQQPHAGGLFRLRPGVRGLPTEAYRG
jgi:sugar lactone lactonase YvrE